MNAIANILNEISSNLLGLYATFVLLRFVFQWVKADFYNPISQGLVKATTPVLKPMRRIIPGLGGLDIAALVIVYIINFISLSITALLMGKGLVALLPTIAIASIIKLLASLLNVASFCMVGSIILSFVAPMSSHPMALLINQVAGPIMAPVRKVLPDLGPIDISPIFIFIALSALTQLLAAIGGSLGIAIGNIWLFLFVMYV